MNPTAPFHLNGQDIWVFGGAGYLGRAVTSILVSLQARVLCVDLADHAQNAVSEMGLEPKSRPPRWMPMIRARWSRF